MATSLRTADILFNDGTTQTTSKPASATAVASTSGTAIDFTGIPSWAKRITVIFNNVSTNGANNILIQIGSGAFTTSGYSSSCADVGNANSTATVSSTSGFVIRNFAAASTVHGAMTIFLIGSNIYIASLSTSNNWAVNGECGGGGVTLGGTLDRVRLTTVGGTDSFDLGSVNIFWD